MCFVNYADYMNAITPDELLEGLLSKGLLGDKLPPVFQSVSFYNYVATHGLTTFSIRDSGYVTYQAMKFTGDSRRFGVPTPMAYARLCRCLSEHWPKLQSFFGQTTACWPYKVSRIHLRKNAQSDDPKKLFDMNYRNWLSDPDPDASLLFGSSYMVSADIATCFPSVYTHAVPWAIMGKDAAKRNRSVTGHWANELDCCLRHTTNGETHGILIGPHSSNLVAEILLTKVDEELVGKGWRYVRNIDDYTCFVHDEVEAAKFLMNLDGALSRYGLMMNSKKTKVSPLPQALSEVWVSKLQRYPLGAEGEKLRYPRVKAFLQYGVELAEKSGALSVYSYMIKMLSRRIMTEPAETYLRQFSMHLLLRYPYLLPIAQKHLFDAHGFEVEEISKIAESLFVRARDGRDYYSGYYALYYALEYSFPIASFDLDAVINSEDCILRALAYKYVERERDKASRNRLRDVARQIASLDAMYFDEQWLFAYEALSANDLPDEWKHMKLQKVTFWV